MFCIVFEPKLWYYHQFFIVWKSNLWCFCILCVVLEAKLWNYHMFLHFLESWPLCRLLFSNGTPKNALQKNARSASGAKEGPRDENNVCCQMGRRPGSLQPSQAEACRKEIWNSDALYVRSFYKNKLLVAQSQQQKKPVSAINLRFSTCLWQTYRAIIQTIYTGMSHFDSCASNVGLGRIRVVQWLCPG